MGQPVMRVNVAFLRLIIADTQQRYFVPNRSRDKPLLSQRNGGDSRPAGGSAYLVIVLKT